jgi:hypothetical protein
LIVDLLGLADQLADALANYTQAGGTGEAVRQVQNEAVPAMQAAFEKLRSFLSRERLEILAPLIKCCPNFNGGCRSLPYGL